MEKGKRANILIFACSEMPEENRGEVKELLKYNALESKEVISRSRLSARKIQGQTH